MNMKRFVHVVHTLYGGVASVAATIINEQLKYGYAITVAYANYDTAFSSMLTAEIELIHAPIKLYPGGSMLYGMNIPNICDQVKKDHPHDEIIVHAHNVQVVGLLSNMKGIKYVCTLHSMRGKDKGVRPIISDFIYRLILKKVIKDGGKIACVSKAISDFYNRDNLPITVVFNGVECENKKYSHKGFVIGHIGNISIAKGWDTLSKAFSMIPDDIRKDMKLLAAGKMQSYSMTEFEENNKLLKIDSQLEYLGFVNNASEVLYPKIDVLVLASKNEGLPMCIVEAFGHSTPVIATKVGGIPEIIEDRYNGFLIDTPEQLANCIIQLYEDKTLYNQMCVNARESYEKSLSSEIMYKKYVNLYNEL